MLRICQNCQSPFRPHKNVPHQKYCSNKQCQSVRRQKWQRKRLKTDEDYREAQLEAQSTWRKKNPDYWRNYRKNHPGYVERNRQLQKKRNNRSRRGLKSTDAESQMIAKMDALIQKSKVTPGYYMLSPIALGKVAKMDELIVRIDVISNA